MSRIEKAIELATKKRQAVAAKAAEPVAKAAVNITEPEKVKPETVVVKPAIPSKPVAEEAVAEEAVVSAQPPSQPQKRNSAHDAFSGIDSPLVRNPFLVTASSDNGATAEQYRKLKSVIVKLAQLKRFDKSLMVTSAIGGEGKSLTSLNLAITLAQEFDHTVLLVEADIRRPTIMQYLEMEAPIGLTDCALDDIDVSEALVKTGIGNLSILPAGRAVPNPVELFSSNRMQNLLSEIKNRYSDRYVIVDTTPLLPFAEPQFIANAIGSVLLVVREGYTSADKVTKALALLENHNVLGVVCNAVRQVNTGGKNGYYGYSGYKVTGEL